MPKRGSVALVACERCRARKVRCDGSMPSCGQCLRQRSECEYASNPEIPRTAALKSKYDRLETSHRDLLELLQHLRDNSTSETAALVRRIKSGDERIKTVMDQAQGLSSGSRTLETSSMSSSSHYGMDGVAAGPATPGMQNIAKRQTQGDQWKQSRDPLLGISHKVLFWPIVLTHIMDAGTTASKIDLQCILEFGSPWLLTARSRDRVSRFPLDTGLPSSRLHSGATTFPELTIRRVDELCIAYFDTFNSLFPLLEMHSFLDGTIARLTREGYKDSDPEAILGLLVFALGELAIDGGNVDSQRSGHCNFCGCGLMSRPGSGYFNEACRRIKAINSQDYLKVVQIELLQAAYFGAVTRHSDSFAAISTASSACISLLKTQSVDWSSPRGGLIKRAYWLCVLHERLFFIEFRVPLTGIEDWEDEVPLPHLGHQLQPLDYPRSPLSGNVPLEQDTATCYFSAMVTLSRLIRRINDFIYGYESACDDAEPLLSFAGESSNAKDNARHIEEYQGPPRRIVEEMTHQLDQWRNALPGILQWKDSTHQDFANVRLREQHPYLRFFGHVLHTEFQGGPHDLDLIPAHLRVRFYHARYLLYRPFIYKALHKPQLMTDIDRDQCKISIESACLWPLSLNPPKDKRHILPHLFAWTQNFVSLTLMIRACYDSRVFEELGDDTGKMRVDAERSSAVMTEWLQDARGEDDIADWALNTLGPF